MGTEPKVIPTQMWPRIIVIAAGVVLIAAGFMTGISLAALLGSVLCIGGVVSGVKYFWTHDEPS
ncbi:hypothetical protein DEALK_00780 [Dehalogenimonas alkenigignens]|uniref:Uncharacterized protein n=1 Tax=Dehalogenimonas alkenigignens TaxID=1217799 RepID=A0A0W0GKS4_9CHLR|nr:DUF308 domain-containing protein [Dehalogenimonas alkenigignens]KTB49166.1 hypothetical protein DEALK_00780 [Dehalogenimonas alkenigignens]